MARRAIHRQRRGEDKEVSKKAGHRVMAVVVVEEEDGGWLAVDWRCAKRRFDRG